MRRLGKFRAAALVALGGLVASVGPAMAAGSAPAITPAAAEQLAHMGQGVMPLGRNCPMGMTGQDMPGQGTMGQGMMGPGMMGQGMMGQGMQSQGMMGPGMMGQAMPGQGMMGPRAGTRIEPSRDLTSDDVRHYLQHSLEQVDNKRLKVGEVTEQDGDTIVAEIVTQDGALVDKFTVDRHSGEMERTY